MGITAFAGNMRWIGTDARWRSKTGLLASAAAVAMLAAAPPPASAGCTTPDNVAVVTCSGDLSGGVSVSNPVTRKLVIEQATTNITPAAGMDGINFVPTSATIPLAELRSDLSKSPGGQDRFRITVSGSLADGINASGRAPALLVDSTGNITVTSTVSTAQNNGIAAAITRTGGGPFDNKVYSKGDISVLTASPRSYGIVARTGNEGSPNAIAGAIRVDSTGNITSATGTGILAGDNAVRPNMAVTADITVISRGNITAGNEGIIARTGKGSISVTSTGQITAGGDRGISAQCVACSGNVSVSNTGDITGSHTAQSIFAQTESGKTTVISSGVLSRGIQAGGGLEAYVGNNGRIDDVGINASSISGKGEIKSTGDVRGGNAMVASGNQGARVENKGNIVAVGSGLAAYTRWGEAVITNTDSRSSLITSEETGIASSAQHDATIRIDNGARIDAFYRGIETRSQRGATTVTNTGAVEATKFSGIRLYSYDSGSLELKNSASVTGGTSGIVLQSQTGNVTIHQTGGRSPQRRYPRKRTSFPSSASRTAAPASAPLRAALASSR